ncbi:MAG: thioredoxin family protein [Verrucomicrobia bacterium]|nr:thioredoxin family protein [Verrucomicrobiota bacterium]
MRLVAVAAGILLSASTTWAAARNTTQADLILSAETAKPGETVLAGVHLRMAKDWHTYWRNSGESGMPTSIAWKLPAGFTAGDVQWPPPERYVAEDIVTYVYHHDAVLLVPLTVSADAPRGEHEIVAKVSWLECKVDCVPGEGTVRAKLNIGNETKPSPSAGILKAAQAKIPKPEPRLNARAWWERGTNADSRQLVIEWAALKPEAKGDFFAYENSSLDISAKTESVSSGPGKLRVRKSVKKSEGNWPAEVAGLIVEKSGEASAAYEAKLAVASAASPDAAAAARGTDSPPPKASASLLAMLGWAFLGGLILNIMPCVLPVIALKILGFVNQSREAPGRVRRLGVIYTLGVLASFLVLAGAVIAVQQAGHKASWGMQFGNPIFLVVLTTLVTLVALNLFGVFEVTLGGGAMGAAAELAGQEGGAGAFFNGVLATALATPCTAPFLSIALGFAFTQPATVIVLMFLAVGAGLALPYLVLSWQPAWLRFLPKPGAWMEKFKIGMGFPMMATAVWLFTLAQGHYGKRSWWLGFFLVLVALAAWVYGEFLQRGRARRGLAWGVFGFLLLFGYGYAMESQLRWRSPVEETAAAILKESPDGIAWEAWSRAAVDKARADGRVVFVDFTADWCVTCQANKKTSIEVPSVRAKLKEINAVPLLGDYTKTPPAITDELSRFSRAGVPLVLVYPKNPHAEPIVLPEVLTPGIVLRALTKAVQ